MNTTRVGKIGEAEVIKRAIEKGFNISIPFQEDISYDLVLDDGQELYRVQVKTINSNGRRIKINLKSSNNWSVKHYNENDIDFILGVDLTTNKIIKVDDFSQHSITVRIKQAKNNQSKNINQIEDYIW